MEFKTLSSTGNISVVNHNRNKINPLLSSIIAIVLQLIATVYVYVTTESLVSTTISGLILLAYIKISYWLVK